MLDSDFALLPFALARLRERAVVAPADVGNLASSCEWDTGSVTPFPPVPTAIMDFPAFLAWLSSVSISEKLECIRRTVFDRIRYADSRAWEFEFHLDLASRWKIELSSEVLVRIFSDAPNRLTADDGPSAVARVLQDAPDKLSSFESAIANHGAALCRWAPGLLSYLRVLAGAQAAFTGDRLAAARHAASVLKRRPWAPAAWSVLGLLLLGPNMAAWATVQRRRRRAR